MSAYSIASGARRFGWQALDIAAAVLLTSIAVGEVATPHEVTPLAAIAAVSLGSTVGWCRRAPAAAVCIGLVSGAVLDAAGANLAIGPLVAAIVYFMLGRRSAAGRARLADALLVALPVPLLAVGPGASHVVDVASVWLFFVATPFAAGWWVGRGTLLAAELRETVDELAWQQRDRARRAASDERVRIARELHDVVAHNVSVMVVQTQAARRVAAADPVAASTALQAVSDCGRDALVDMRRMIGVLHRGDVELAAPGLAQLPALVQRAEASGLQVTLHVGRAARPLPPSVDLAAYRVVQEAVTNVIKHAGATRASITVVHAPRAVELDISDDGRGPDAASTAGHAAGHGVIGMRERLALYGGELRVGGNPGGGFRVTARIPVDSERPV